MLFKDKIKKADFERKLDEYIGSISYRKHYEIGPEGTKIVNLYYIDGIHAGSWCKGVGWIFDNMSLRNKK